MLEKFTPGLYNCRMKRIIATVFAVFSLVVFAVSCGKGQIDYGDDKKIINSAVFVNFAGGEGFTNEKTERAKAVFSSGENSLEGYISFASEGKISVSTEILGEITLDNSSDYYMPAYAESEEGYELISEVGYDNRMYKGGTPDPRGDKQSAEAFLRTEELIAEATQKLNEKGLKANTDGDNDGAADCITLVFDLPFVPAANSLLWAKQGRFLAFNAGELGTAYYVDDKYSETEIKEQKLGNKSINDYIFMPLPMMVTGENLSSAAICHEFLHVLGAADLYSYTDKGKEAVGELDIMAASYGGIPAMPLSYTRYKIGFLSEGENVAPILKSGEYDLFSTESGKGKIKAYKLVLPEFSARKESFYIEYREKIGYGEGLSNDFTDGAFIVYRVNEDNGYVSPDGRTYGSNYLGNAYGENEVYVFRFGKTNSSGDFTENETVSKNNISHASISDKTGYTSFGGEGKKGNVICYSDGTNTGVSVSFKKRNENGSATFEIKFDRNVKTPAEVDKPTIFKSRSGKITLFLDAPMQSGNMYIFESDKLISGVTAEGVASGKYGETKTIPAAFMRAEISGEKNYVYVAEDTGGELKLYVYALKAEEKSIVKGALVTGGIIFAVAAISVVVVAVVMAKKRKSNAGDDGKQ